MDVVNRILGYLALMGLGLTFWALAIAWLTLRREK
jgi:hypothetical protein